MANSGIKKLSFSIEEILSSNDEKLDQNFFKTTHKTEELLKAEAAVLMSKQFLQSNYNAYGKF